MDLAQKQQRLAVLPYLRITGRDPDSGAVHIVQRPLRQDGTSFREGDGVILYRHEGADARPLQGPLFKGTITAIDHRLGEATVMLYDRHAVLDTSAFWALEADASGGLITSQYAGLLHFLQVPAARRALLMGMEAPRSLDPAVLDVHPARELTPHQRELLGQALAAQDYFLMQGPPGSGKTQMMMVEMVRHLVHHTDEAVLLMAYTNRAVGEMCHALSGDTDPALHGYLVFGRDAGLDDQIRGNSFVSCVEEHGATEGRALAARSRVFVATVAMCTQHPEILQELKRRRVRVTAIVDEAAQLLEPQVIGILADVDRAILIGDERQLPAVVQQPAQLAAVTDPVLLDAGFRDLRMSLFERLLRRCEEQGWTNAYGMLTDQARMHQDIVAFPDREFYGGRLQPLYDWQSSAEPAFEPDANDALECLLAARRVLFIPSSEQDGVSRVHEQEARRVARLVQAFAAAYRRQDPTLRSGRVHRRHHALPRPGRVHLPCPARRPAGCHRGHRGTLPGWRARHHHRVVRRPLCLPDAVHHRSVLGRVRRPQAQRHADAGQEAPRAPRRPARPGGLTPRRRQSLASCPSAAVPARTGSMDGGAGETAGR